MPRFSEPTSAATAAGCPAAPVIVCEGEKAAAAAGKRFPDYIATTSPNGAGSADKADWSPLGEAAVPVLRPGGGHVWLHPGCVHPFNAHRRNEARRALAEAGIAAPPATSNERK